MLWFADYLKTKTKFEKKMLFIVLSILFLTCFWSGSYNDLTLLYNQIIFLFKDAPVNNEGLIDLVLQYFFSIGFIFYVLITMLMAMFLYCFFSVILLTFFFKIFSRFHLEDKIFKKYREDGSRYERYHEEARIYHTKKDLSFSKRFFLSIIFYGIFIIMNPFISLLIHKNFLLTIFGIFDTKIFDFLGWTIENVWSV